MQSIFLKIKTADGQTVSGLMQNTMGQHDVLVNNYHTMGEACHAEGLTSDHFSKAGSKELGAAAYDSIEVEAIRYVGDGAEAAMTTAPNYRTDEQKAMAKRVQDRASDVRKGLRAALKSIEEAAAAAEAGEPLTARMMEHTIADQLTKISARIKKRSTHQNRMHCDYHDVLSGLNTAIKALNKAKAVK